MSGHTLVGEQIADAYERFAVGRGVTVRHRAVAEVQRHNERVVEERQVRRGQREAVRRAIHA